MLTRRVHGGVFLLSPSKDTTQVVGYVVAVMQSKWSIDLHALCFMSNHWHACLTDPEGNVVEFQRDCHHFISSALNARYGDDESLWSPHRTSRVECLEPLDLVRKIGYTMANPVKHGVVRHAKSWLGLRRAWPSKPLTFTRPAWYFRGESEGGVWPETATLEMMRPPGYEHLDDEELAAFIGAVVEQHEAKHQRRHDAAGRTFLGRRAIRDQSRYSRPARRPRGSEISPKVAAANRDVRQARLHFNKRWQCAYQAAMAAWRAGNRAVIFPVGTYKMRTVHGVGCARAFG